MKDLRAERLNDAQMWLRRAASDLFVAENMASHGGDEQNHICLHAQQAAEKALKSVLTFHAQPIEKVHRLTVLRNRIPSDDAWPIPGSDFELNTLSDWATESRYGDPHNIHSIASSEDAQTALTLAQRIFHAILEEMARRGNSPQIDFIHMLQPSSPPTNGGKPPNA